MDRKQRRAVRGRQAIARLNETALIIDKAMSAAGIPMADKVTFLNWAIGSAWENFKEDRKNQRVMIENEIRQLSLRFPNGTVNKDYSITFELPTEKICDIELIGAEELGLAMTEEGDRKFRVSGKPALQGDFTLKLRFNTINGEEASELSIPIAFNPDPRDLWRNIRTDKGIAFYKEDSAQDYVKVESDKDGNERKDIVAASQRGRSHAQEGRPRDDHFSIYHCDDSDWYIIAVADGAGSAKFSRKGSEVACNTVVEHCKNLLLDNPALEKSICEYAAAKENDAKRGAMQRQVIDILYKGAVKAHENIKKTAEANEGTRLKDFATTLMFAFCKKYDFGWFIASFWVGDGAMCLFDKEKKEATLLGTPDEGEFSGQTRFLTMPEIFRDPELVQKRMRIKIVPDFTALFLMTDGVSDPMFETERNLNDYTKWEEFYHKLLHGFPEDEIPGVELKDDNEESRHQLLRWLDFWSAGNHDDRTIAILY